MNQHILETLASLHSRLARLEHQVNLTGREITEPTTQETPTLYDSLSWDNLWDHVTEWGRKTDYNLENHVEDNRELTATGAIIARWILAHPRPYPETMRWAERESTDLPTTPTISLSVYDLMSAMQEDRLSNDQ